MNFTINRDTLLLNLTHVSKALSAKVQMPGLSGIKFNVNKDQILLTASNNEISIQTKITDNKMFKVIEDGEFVVQGKYLLDETLVGILNSEFIITDEFISEREEIED